MSKKLVASSRVRELKQVEKELDFLKKCRILTGA